MHQTGTVDASRSKRLWHDGLGAVAALAPFIATSWWSDTPDGLLHLQRSRALAEALQMGLIFPRLFPDFAFGYGYPVFNFYTPLFYYPPASPQSPLALAGSDVPFVTDARLEVRP